MIEGKIKVPDFNVDKTMDGLEELLERQSIESVLSDIRVHWKFITSVHIDCLKAQRVCIELLISELSESRDTVQEHNAFIAAHPEIRLMKRMEERHGNS